MEKSIAGSVAASTIPMDEVKLCCSKDQGCCDLISQLPNDILVNILQKLDSKSAVSTSILSRRWRHMWTFLQSLHLSEMALPDNTSRVRLEPVSKAYFSKNKQHHFVESAQWLTGLKSKVALRRLSFVFSGSEECADAVSGAIASAFEHGIEDIDVAIVRDHSYQFPSWLFSGERGSSLTSLCLSFCKLSVPLNFRGFSSLTKLALIRMNMNLKEIQLALASCPNLVILHLVRMFDIRSIQLPKLKELVWNWCPPSDEVQIDTPALQRLEYYGEMFPLSSFKCIPCLEHVSLLYDDYDDPVYHAKKLENISSFFPHVRSLFLRYEIPKFVRPRKLSIFSNLKVLTLNINTKSSDDLLWMLMFVVAAPCLETLRTTVRYLSLFESNNGVVWADHNFEHNNLKEVQMYNFMGRDNEIIFARLLLRRAPNLRSMAFSQAPLCEADDRQLLSPDWCRAEVFSPRDNQFVVSKLFEGVSSGAHVLFM
ncbi:hypothetical protein ACP70R_006859 [Stipagrostis hirtigluma subsp. patula]